MLGNYCAFWQKNIVLGVLCVMLFSGDAYAPTFNIDQAKIVFDSYKNSSGWQNGSPGVSAAASAITTLSSVIAQYSGSLELTNPDVKTALDKARMLVSNYKQGFADAAGLQAEMPNIQAAYDAYALYFNTVLITNITTASAALASATAALTSSVDALAQGLKDLQSMFATPIEGVPIPSFVVG